MQGMEAQITSTEPGSWERRRFWISMQMSGWKWGSMSTVTVSNPRIEAAAAMCPEPLKSSRKRGFLVAGLWACRLQPGG